MDSSNLPYDNPQKRRTGWSRLLHATGYSLAGLRHGWAEPAFRTEAVLALLMLATAPWIGSNWIEISVLCAVVVLVLVVELLNTALEAVVDRASPEWHVLAGKAKDMASAAVLLSLALCALVWIFALWHRLT